MPPSVMLDLPSAMTILGERIRVRLEDCYKIDGIRALEASSMLLEVGSSVMLRSLKQPDLAGNGSMCVVSGE